MLTFPPHCTHKLQPMDRAIFGPLKKAINTACDNWMRSNASKVMSIHDIPSITKTAFGVAITAKNIISGFFATGLWPVNTEIFNESDFLPSQVTDRPLPNAVQNVLENLVDGDEVVSILVVENDDRASTSSPSLLASEATKTTEDKAVAVVALPADTEPVPSTSKSRTSNVFSPQATVDSEPIASTSKFTPNVFSPEAIRPLPKAPPRKGTQTNRRKIKSAVLTDTPTKDEIAAIEANRKTKNVKKRILTDEKSNRGKKDKNGESSMPKDTKQKQKKRKAINEGSEDDDDEENCFCLCCLEPFASSRSKEKWVQCIECKGWSHEACTGGELGYICHHCTSDED